MCFTFLTGCFGAINSSTRCIDLDGDYNTVMHTEYCLRVACQVSTSHQVLASYEQEKPGSPKLQHRSNRNTSSHLTKESPTSQWAGKDEDENVHSDLKAVREEIMIGREVGGELMARRNSWRKQMIKFNLCFFFFCRGWWAFLLLQLHMFQALAQVGDSQFPISRFDDVAPYFKTEPGLPQIHLEGNRLVLTCLAEGSWPLEFKWICNDNEITTYTSEYKYIIPSLERTDAGFYRCVVRNRMGALLQRKSEVQVAYMGNFIDADQRKTVFQGGAAVLNLPHIISYPRPQVTWFRDGHKIIPSSRIAITLENQLVILATTAGDTGGYYVQAVNEKNGENKTSPFTYLSIESEF